MKSLMSLFAVVMVLVPLPVSVCAQTGNVGATIQGAGKQWSAGLVGGYETQIGKFQFDADAQVQLIGKKRIVSGHLDILFDVGVIDIKVPIDITSQWFREKKVGFDANYFVALSVPIEGLNVDIGIGGKSARPWDEPTENGRWEDGKIVKDEDGEILIESPSDGFEYDDRTSVKAMIATGFESPKFEIGVRAIVDFLDISDGYHQIDTQFITHQNLFGLGLDIGLDVLLVARKKKNKRVLEEYPILMNTITYRF